MLSASWWDGQTEPKQWYVSKELLSGKKAGMLFGIANDLFHCVLCQHTMEDAWYLKLIIVE